MDDIVWRKKNWAVWGLITFLAISTSTVGIPYLTDSNNIIQSGFGHHLSDRPILMYVYFIFGPLALFIGSLNFMPLSDIKI